jgi:hypothetical protein
MLPAHNWSLPVVHRDSKRLAAVAAELDRAGKVETMAALAGGAEAAVKLAELEALMRIAIDYGPHGVRANTVRPRLFISPQSEVVIRSFHPDPKVWIDGYVSSKQLLPSLIEAERVGEAGPVVAERESGLRSGTDPRDRCRKQRHAL